MKISIGTNLIISFLLFVVLLGALAYYSVFVSKTFLEQSVGKSSVFLAEEMLRIVDKSTYSKIEELQRYSQNALLQNTVVQSNKEFEKREDREEYINRTKDEDINLPPVFKDRDRDNVSINDDGTITINPDI